MKTYELMSRCASMINPPKGYGSIEAGLKVAAFRSKRMTYWEKELGGKGYTAEVFERVQADVISEWGEAF